MKLFCDLEERHSVDIDESYQNDHACATFVEFIAIHLQQKLRREIANFKFFSVQIDSTTDCGNIEEELFMVLYFDAKSPDRKVIVRDKFFTVRQLRRGTGQGLYDCFKQAMAYVEVPPTEWKQKMIGLGCDGTAANLRRGGLKGHLETDMSWIIVSWCLVQRLELSVKDALKTRFSVRVDELLL